VKEHEKAQVQIALGATRMAGEAEGMYWGQHPDHPVEDWQAEVANGDTRQGYWEWAYQREQED